MSSNRTEQNKTKIVMVFGPYSNNKSELRNSITQASNAN